MADLITLAALSGSSAYDPSVLIADADGDLFGATEFGGAVFEVAKTADGYASTPTILVTLSDGGYQPVGGLITDANGNLFGTDEYGGTVLEIAKTDTGYASTPTTVVSLTGSGADFPVGGLIADAAGDLFGTTEFGGSNGAGTVFEIAKTASGYASTPTILVSLTSSTVAGLVADDKGDLFGTTTTGGASGDGTVFEIAKTATGYSSTPTIVASFTMSDGTTPETGLILDARGDLFGTTTAGGAGGDGTVFEITKTASGYESTPTILAAFNGDDGADPLGALIEDAKGDLFGTTTSGGANDDGTVFEIARTSGGYASTPITLISFDSTDGSDPDTGLIADAKGDLFGATGAGADNDGTVFEVTNSGYVIPCFCRGTMILTPRGDVAVEDLAMGDLVVTARGTVASIRWIGRRHIGLSAMANHAAVQPVRVAAHAFGPGRPRRDLFLSPDHAVFAEDVLIPIKLLINGSTIKQVPVDAVTYYHIELSAHDVLLAERLPCESYLDTGNRTAFVNGGAFVEARPDFSPRHWAQTCWPLIFDGPVMDRIRQALFVRAKLLGHAVTRESGVHLMADGRRIAPVPMGPTRILFLLPQGCADISLRSRCFVPAHTCPPSRDGRSLGLCVGQIRIDDTPIALDEDGPLDRGWHAFEQGAGYPAQRWTTGVTPLPTGARRIVLDLAGPGYYWRVDDDLEQVPRQAVGG